jgi:hypothetical protein
MKNLIAVVLLFAGVILAWEDKVGFEKGCSYGSGTDCPCFSPHTHWEINIQGCIPDDSTPEPGAKENQSR